MILQSHDRFVDYVEFNPSSGKYVFKTREDDSTLPLAGKNGFYSNVDGTIVSLYRMGDSLRLRIGSIEFEVTADVNSTLDREKSKHVFKLFKQEALLTQLEYKPAINEVPPVFDFTAFVDDEDFDFLLFVHNVLTNKGRRQRLFDLWG